MFSVRRRHDDRPAADQENHEGSGRGVGFEWFAREMLRHRPVWRDVLIASLVIQIIGLATPLLTQSLIDKVVVHRSTSSLTVIAVALVVFVLFSATMTWIRQYLILHAGSRVDAVLGAEVFSHLLRVPAPYFDKRPTGVLVARLQGVETVREFLSGATLAVVLDLPFLLLCLALMFWYSWALTLIAVAILAVIVGISIGTTPMLRRRLNAQFLLAARNQGFVTEHVANPETVKALQLEPQLDRRYGEYLASYLAASVRTRTLVNTCNVTASGLEQLMTVTLLCVGVWFVMTGAGLTIGMLVAFQMLAGRVSQPLLRLVGLWQEFQQAVIAVRRLGDILDVRREPSTIIPARRRASRGRIAFEAVSFRYGAQRPWLYRGFDLAIEPGEFVAILGRSGSGKSTLAKLLQGFHPPAEGVLRLDGHDVTQLAVNELRSSLGVVPQETVLFSGSVYDNLACADPRATFDDVVDACRRAGIHGFIESLPEGYRTAIGERGAGLSGGQKQRIAIARALLRRPAVLLFDEATSSLDAETEQQIAATLMQLRGRVTILFITHHLPEGLEPDRIVRLSPAVASNPEVDHD
ncbi:MAG: peptidase domain-containing ABC transporter [Burkholderiales bacterium]|nr:peptidase domain-containing ABC transporter [Burkholderiales bacterium]